MSRESKCFFCVVLTFSCRAGCFTADKTTQSHLTLLNSKPVVLIHQGVTMLLGHRVRINVAADGFGKINIFLTFCRSMTDYKCQVSVLIQEQNTQRLPQRAIKSHIAAKT